MQNWLLANIDSELSVPILADKVAMSVRNFSRLFRKETGSSPAEFIEFARIDTAKRLLEDTDIPLKRIAAHSGFTNVDVMRRTFIRHLSISPNDHRTRFKG